MRYQKTSIMSLRLCDSVINPNYQHGPTVFHFCYEISMAWLMAFTEK